MPVTAESDLAFAERDLSMLKGGGMESDRPYITWGQLLALRKAGRGQELRKYALIMRAPGPGKSAIPGAGPAIAMPAEKESKWYGQGFRACVSIDDQALVEFPPPPEPNIWVPSMIEEAIQRGEIVPKEMAPPGYMGRVFSIEAMRAQTFEEPVAGPEVFRCPAEGCTRFFDSEQGVTSHERSHGTTAKVAE